MKEDESFKFLSKIIMNPETVGDAGKGSRNEPSEYKAIAALNSPIPETDGSSITLKLEICINNRINKLLL